jgi:hypothetical protein
MATVARTPSECARFQISSPDFADFCVTHLADPAYGFLFSRSAPGRQEYERTLAAIAGALGAGQANSNGALTSSNGHANVNGHAAAATSTSAPAPTPVVVVAAAFPVPSATNYCGPHKPYPLDAASIEEFDTLVARLGTIRGMQVALSHGTHPRDALVQYMLRRPTKTEFMVHRIVAGLRGMSKAKRVDAFCVLSTLYYELQHAAESNVPAKKMPYKAVFDKYLVEAVSRTLQGSRPDDEGSKYVRQVIDGWANTAAVEPTILAAMNEAFRTHA